MENLGTFRIAEEYEGYFNCYWTPPNSDKEHPLVSQTEKKQNDTLNDYAKKYLLIYAESEARKILKAWREGEIIRTDPRTLTGEALLQHIAAMLHIVFDKLDK